MSLRELKSKAGYRKFEVDSFWHAKDNLSFLERSVGYSSFMGQENDQSHTGNRRLTSARMHSVRKAMPMAIWIGSGRI
jgi:hypothetical protein